MTANDPVHLPPAPSPAPFECSHCLEGLDEPADDGVCTECLESLGALRHRCCTCGQDCSVVREPGKLYRVSACCKGVTYHVGATVLELAELSRIASEEGEAHRAETLLRLAIIQRRSERPVARRAA